MSWDLALGIYIFMLMALLLGGVWIGLALGVTGVFGITVWSGIKLWPSFGEVFWNISNSFTLTAVPLFVLMGSIILHSGISKRFYRGISLWLRPIPGGLLHSNIVGCAIFAAISGSSTATALTIGTVAIPEMRSRGYNDAILLGSLAGGGCLGILIPPSIPMVIYGSMVQESIAKLFMGGFLPGILLSLIFMSYILTLVLIKPSLAPRETKKANLEELLVGLLNCWPVGLLILAIMGGIYFGVVTPTEAAAIGCGISILLSIVYRELTWKALKNSLASAVAANCVIMFIILGAQLLTFALVNSGIPRELTKFIISMQIPQWEFFLLICIMYGILGCFIDGISMMLLTLPLLYPVVISMGFDSIWFGIVLVVLIEFGQLTPPMGLNLFAIHSISEGSPLSEIVKGSMPYIMMIGFLVFLLYLFPDIALFLPRTMK
jgi:C4-dicarboxylate transporter, DctM subunit